MKRKENESIKTYRLRRMMEQETTKQKLKGKLLWNSATQGTYERVKHGPLK